MRGGTGENIGHDQILTVTKRSLPPVVCLFFSFGLPPGPEEVWMMRTVHMFLRLLLMICLV